MTYFTPYCLAICITIVSWGSISAGEEKPGTNNRQQTVVAEGRGADEVSALRNAFQEAVGQVVGLVVDSQTRIKNDEVIRDKVLIASNGYVSSFKKLESGSKGGVWLVKIRAVVERKALIEKLVTERVTVLKPATADLFGEVASDLKAVEGASQLLCERLSEIQLSWTATAGKPSFDRVSGKLSVPISIMGNSASYTASAKRLVELLDKIRLSKKRKVLSGIPCKAKGGLPTPGRFLANFSSSQKQRGEAKSFQGKAAIDHYARQQWKGYNVTDWLCAEDYDKLPPHAFWIWLCVSHRAGHTEWLGYAVDVDMAKVAPMLCPTWSLAVSLKDGSGGVVSHWKRKALTFKSHYPYISCDPVIANEGGIAQPGLHPHWVSMGNVRYARSGSGFRRPWKAGSENGKYAVTNSSWSDGAGIYRQRALIAPFFLSLAVDFGEHSTDGTLAYWPKELIVSSFKMSPDEILEVKDVEVEFLPSPWTLAK